jgi:hypothetical protein
LLSYGCSVTGYLFLRNYKGWQGIGARQIFYYFTFFYKS